MPRPQQAGVDQRGELLQQIVLVQLGHRRCRIQRDGPPEHRQLAQNVAGLRCQQLIAPGHRRVQGAVPRFGIDGSGVRSGQFPAKALTQRARAEQGRPRRGKLKGQREPVQVHRQRGRAPQRLLAVGPARARRLSAFQQENRGIAADPAAVLVVHVQRIQDEPMLPRDPGSHPAGHQQGEPRAGIQQPRQQHRGARQKVLQVVQHQQHPARPQARQQRLARVPPRFFTDSQGVRERGWQGCRLGQAGQRHPGHTIGVQPLGLRLDPRDVYHQAGLPDSAGAEHGDQPDPGLPSRARIPLMSLSRPIRSLCGAGTAASGGSRAAAVRGRASTSRCARCTCSPGSAPSSSRSIARTRW